MLTVMALMILCAVPAVYAEENPSGAFPTSESVDANEDIIVNTKGDEGIGNNGDAAITVEGLIMIPPEKTTPVSVPQTGDNVRAKHGMISLLTFAFTSLLITLIIRKGEVEG